MSNILSFPSPDNGLARFSLVAKSILSPHITNIVHMEEMYSYLCDLEFAKALTELVQMVDVAERGKCAGLLIDLLEAINENEFNRKLISISSYQMTPEEKLKAYTFVRTGGNKVQAIKTLYYCTGLDGDVLLNSYNYATMTLWKLQYLYEGEKFSELSETARKKNALCVELFTEHGFSAKNALEAHCVLGGSAANYGIQLQKKLVLSRNRSDCVFDITIHNGITRMSLSAEDYSCEVRIDNDRLELLARAVYFGSEALVTKLLTAFSGSDASEVLALKKAAHTLIAFARS